MGDEIAKTGAKAFDQPGLRRRDKPRPVVIIKRQPRELAAKIGEDRAVVGARLRSEEHTSELQSLMRISYAVFCLKHKTSKHIFTQHNTHLSTSITKLTHNYHT